MTELFTRFLINQTVVQSGAWVVPGGSAVTLFGLLNRAAGVLSRFVCATRASVNIGSGKLVGVYKLARSRQNGDGQDDEDHGGRHRLQNLLTLLEGNLLFDTLHHIGRKVATFSVMVAENVKDWHFLEHDLRLIDI